MSGTGSGTTPTLVGWLAALLVGLLAFALLRYQVGFLMPSAIAVGVAATLLVILLLSSPGRAEDVAETRVRKIVVQPEAAAEPALRPVAPTRVVAAPKPAAPAAEAALAPVVASAEAAPSVPAGFVSAPPAAAELAPRTKARAAEPVPAVEPAETAVAKDETRPKAAKTRSGAKSRSKATAADIPPAPTEGPVRLASPRGGKADDLKEIEGIGPALEKLVNSLGIYHYDQIAGWSDADVAAIDAESPKFKGRIARDRWVAQARIIMTEGLEAFRERAKTNDY